MADNFQPSGAKGLPIATELPSFVYQQHKPGSAAPSRNGNNVESAYEQFIQAPYPRNDTPPTRPVPHDTARRMSGLRLSIIAVLAIVSAYFVSPLSPVKALAGYDILAAAVLPVAGMCAIIWSVRRGR